MSPRSKEIQERLLRDRIVMIGTPIDDEIANVAIAQLLFLQSEDPRAGISLYLNSPGGSVTASLAICDTLKFLQQPVSTICMGQCQGTAALLLACGTRGQRFSLPQGRIALVPIQMGAGPVDDVMLAAHRKYFDALAELFVERTGQTRERVLYDLSHGRSFDPEGARAYGLIDLVVKR